MPKRLLHLICGLVTIGALAAIPTAATAGTPSNCDDHYPPYSRWGHGWYGHDRDGRYWRGWDDGDGYFGGRSWDGYCNAADRLGKVDRVMVAVQRLRGERCQHLFRSGRLGRPTGCTPRHWMRARGTRHWHHSIPRSLPRGHYVIHHQAIDEAGNRGLMRHRHVVIR
jgi:hypothetical protein